MFSVPDSVVVRRPFTLNGVEVPAGTSLTKEQVVAIGRELDALLDNGTLVAKPDPFARRNKQPQPTSLPPVIRNAMLSKMGPAPKPFSVSATAAGTSVSVSFTGGVAPFDVAGDWGDTTQSTTRTAMFENVPAGEHQLDATDGSGASASTTVTVSDSAKKPSRKKAGS